MSDKGFNVTGVRPESVRDRRGNFVPGFAVDFFLIEFEENHTLMVTDAERNEVERLIGEFIQWRRGLV